MGYKPHQLRDAFEGQGEAGFMVWTYATFDPIEAVMADGYFDGRARVRAGDLIYLGINPRPEDTPWRTQHLATAYRRALLMVSSVERSRVCVRLVQDFGGLEGEAAPAAVPAKARRPSGAKAPARAKAGAKAPAKG